MDVDEVGDGMEMGMGKEMKGGSEWRCRQRVMGTGVMDVDEDRDRGGDEYGDEDGGPGENWGAGLGKSC